MHSGLARGQKVLARPGEHLLPSADVAARFEVEFTEKELVHTLDNHL